MLYHQSVTIVDGVHQLSLCIESLLYIIISGYQLNTYKPFNTFYVVNFGQILQILWGYIQYQIQANGCPSRKALQWMLDGETRHSGDWMDG